MQPIRQKTKLAAVLLTTLAMASAMTLAGCGAGNASYAPPAVMPPATAVAPDASVSGQYNLTLTSMTGRGTTGIFTNFTQTGKTFAGAGTTLVCPSNDPSQCQGSDPSAAPIIPTGTASGQNVIITISFPTTAGADTVTMTGAAKGTTLAGAYTDALGDSGAWTASSAFSPGGDYTGTFNSTANPMMIPANISMSLTQDVTFKLTGTATITHSPCISSLTLAGSPIGGAFTLKDTTNQASIVAIPNSNGINVDFSYKFDPAAPHCAGDLGRGTFAYIDPWAY
ncbi:MAG TPA: hypothetical protein VGJ06_01345 [Candidatus Acidoferrum sp.]